MIIDVHCHVGFSARPVDRGIARFSFEDNGAAGRSGFDSYFSRRMLERPAFYFMRRWLGVDRSLKSGPALDAAIGEIYERHFAEATSVDRLVLLAFDEHHDDAGRPVGGPAGRRGVGSDLYVSNSLVRAMCAADPDRYLFGASIHPYRKQGSRDACDMLEEIATASRPSHPSGDRKSGGAESPSPALVKWLPIHQNIDATDPRTVAFLRKAAELRLPMLIHYGGEFSLSRQCKSFQHPGPMLETLRRLRAEGAMPTVIVAHAATPSLPLQSRHGHDVLMDAMQGEFADAPLYADISALAAFGRTQWLRRLAARTELHSKLVWGSDFPIPIMLFPFRRRLSRCQRRDIAAQPSWIEQSLRVAQSLGFDAQVFHQAAHLLGQRQREPRP